MNKKARHCRTCSDKPPSSKQKSLSLSDLIRQSSLHPKTHYNQDHKDSPIKSANDKREVAANDKRSVNQATDIDNKLVIVGLDPTIFPAHTKKKRIIIKTIKIRRSSRRMTKRWCKRMTNGTSANHKREASVNDKRETLPMMKGSQPMVVIVLTQIKQHESEKYIYITYLLFISAQQRHPMIQSPTRHNQ
jgi:hypothetical protein